MSDSQERLQQMQAEEPQGEDKKDGGDFLFSSITMYWGLTVSRLYPVGRSVLRAVLNPQLVFEVNLLKFASICCLFGECCNIGFENS